MERKAPPAEPAAVRDARRRPSFPSAQTALGIELAPELAPRERAAALSRLGDAAPAGIPLEASRLDEARNRLRAATAQALPASPVPDAQPVDPGAFDAAQRRLRAARSGRRTR